jgi:hypothetical protein
MKTTIEMAREAAGDDWKLFREFMPEIHRLAELVRADERNRTWTQEHWTEYERSIAAAEREACARVCLTEWSTLGQMEAGEAFARAIRARGRDAP